MSPSWDKGEGHPLCCNTGGEGGAQFFLHCKCETLCAKHYCKWLKILTFNVYNPIFQNDENSGPLQKAALWKLRFEFIIQANVDLWLLHSIAVSWSNASGVKGRKENRGIWSFLFSRVFVGNDSKTYFDTTRKPWKTKRITFTFTPVAHFHFLNIFSVWHLYFLP